MGPGFWKNIKIRKIQAWQNKKRRGGKGRLRVFLAAACAALLGAVWGCGETGGMEGLEAESLVVYCPHPQEFIEPVVAEFEARTGIYVTVQQGGTGELLDMVAEGREPGCDIFWGGSLSTTAPRQELFLPYISANEDMVRPEFKNREGSMTRFTDVPSVIMVNTNLIGDLRVEGYGDLLQEELKGRIAMCSPSASSSAWEHLINMLYAMGKGEPEQGWGYVERFCENLDGRLLERSAQVYEGVAKGEFAVGLTFEEGGARYVSQGYPVRLVYMEEGVISKPDVVCIARGAAHLKEAEQFVDFVTGRDAQAVIAGSLNRRSVRLDVKEPLGLPDKNMLPLIYDDLEQVTEKKEQWLGRFEEIYDQAGPGERQEGT